MMTVGRAMMRTILRLISMIVEMPVEEIFENWMIGDQSHDIMTILIEKAGMRITIGLEIKAIVDTTIMAIASTRA
jgi:hypothetical protein